MVSDFNTSLSASDFSDTNSDAIAAQFTPENICGVGGACVVYRVYYDRLRVAVKRLNEKYRGQPAYVASYRKEYDMGRSLKHDALPAYHELHVAENEVYIVMDYVDGISIHDFIKTEEGKEYFSSTDNVRRFFSELVNVTGYLHRSGVIHCDLKPENIMLRHSDRGVMLIDLDKAYSDILHSTHGGTKSISNPLAKGETITADKDIKAIGRVFDIITENVSKFPARKFGRFRKACDSNGITADKLQSELQPHPHRRLWVIYILCIIVLAFMGYIFLDKESHSAQPLPESESTTINIDFDREMNTFTRSAENAVRLLSAGSLSDEQMSDLMLRLVEDYTSAYNQVVTAAKNSNPQMPAIDVELAVARKAENSTALRVLQEFTKAAADTITARSQD